MERLKINFTDYLTRLTDDPELLEQAYVATVVLRHQEHLPEDLVEYQKNLLNELGVNIIDAEAIPRQDWIEAINHLYTMRVLKNGW